MTHIRRIRLPAKQDKKGPTLVIKRGPGSRPHGLEGSIEQFFCKVLTMPIPSLADWISRSLEHWTESHASGVKTFRTRSERKNVIRCSAKASLCTEIIMFWLPRENEDLKVPAIGQVQSHANGTSGADFIQILQWQYCTSRIPRASSSLPQPKSIDQVKQCVTLSHYQKKFLQLLPRSHSRETPGPHPQNTFSKKQTPYNSMKMNCNL